MKAENDPRQGILRDGRTKAHAWLGSSNRSARSNMGSKPIHYVCIDYLPNLVWCANAASLELHRFLHRGQSQLMQLPLP
jgi:hypothetical protein